MIECITLASQSLVDEINIYTNYIENSGIVLSLDLAIQLLILEKDEFKLNFWRISYCSLEYGFNKEFFGYKPVSNDRFLDYCFQVFGGYSEFQSYHCWRKRF
jgi:hypothetical protein